MIIILFGIRKDKKTFGDIYLMVSGFRFPPRHLWPILLKLTSFDRSMDK